MTALVSFFRDLYCSLGGQSFETSCSLVKSALTELVIAERSSARSICSRLWALRILGAPIHGNFPGGCCSARLLPERS